MDSGRRYTDAQLGAIIQRATELHERSGGAEHTLTLAEVEQVAAELGIPVAHVRAAAMEVDAASATRQGVFGGPFSRGVVRALPSSVSEAEWERVVVALRRETGRSGRLDGFGRDWSHGVEDGGVTFYKTYVSLVEEGESTALDLRTHYGGAAVVAYGFSFVLGATAAAIGIDGSGLPESLGPPALIGLTASGGLGGMALVRVGLAVWADRQRERLGRLASRVQAVIGARPEAATEVPLSAPTLDVLPDESETAATPVRSRVR